MADAFGTDNRRAVETYCRDHDITYAWQPDGSLRTWQRRGAVVRHPVTGRRCWFNQIAFLNEWTIAPEIREYLLEVYGEDGLPFNTPFGNGDPIEADVVPALQPVDEAQTGGAPGQAGSHDRGRGGAPRLDRLPHRLDPLHHECTLAPAVLALGEQPHSLHHGIGAAGDEVRHDAPVRLPGSFPMGPVRLRPAPP